MRGTTQYLHLENAAAMPGEIFFAQSLQGVGAFGAGPSTVGVVLGSACGLDSANWLLTSRNRLRGRAGVA